MWDIPIDLFSLYASTFVVDATHANPENQDFDPHFGPRRKGVSAQKFLDCITNVWIVLY